MYSTHEKPNYNQKLKAAGGFNDRRSNISSHYVLMSFKYYIKKISLFEKVAVK